MDWHPPTSHLRTRVDCPNLRRRAYLHYRRRYPKTKTTRIRLKNGASSSVFLLPPDSSSLLKRTGCIYHLDWDMRIILHNTRSPNDWQILVVSSNSHFFTNRCVIL